MGELLGTQDLHVHTTMSDGRLTLHEVVALAVERGVQVGIADHVSARTPHLMVSSEAEFRAYLEALEGADVWRSAEFCWCDDFGLGLPDELLARLDYRVGSNHGFPLPGGGMGSPWWAALPEPWSARPQALMDAMVDELCRMVRTMPIQIAAHSTLTPPALYALEDDVAAWWTPEREDRYVQALARSGVALEISNRYRLPHDALLRKALEAGVRFSLGSDGHSREQVARLEWAAETARRVGITDRQLFVPERRRPRRVRGTGTTTMGRT
jgi:histidinol phosphatase-like PHP family hydrolase